MWWNAFKYIKNIKINIHVTEATDLERWKLFFPFFLLNSGSIKYFK